MAYQNGVATSPIDLLQKLVTFLAANGWTTEASRVEGAGWRAHLSHSGAFINLRAATMHWSYSGAMPAVSQGRSSAV